MASGILTNIFNKIESFFDSRVGIKTQSLLILDWIEENIPSDIIPVIQQCEDKLSILKNRESTKEFTLVKGSLKVSNMKDLLNKYKTYVMDVNSSSKVIKDAITSIMSDTVNEKSMNYMQYSLFHLLETTGNNLETGLRVINYVLLNSHDTLMSSSEIKKVLDSLPMFKLEVIDNKTTLKQKIEEIKKLPKTNIFDAVVSDVPDELVKNVLPNIHMFNGNPIYTFRKWLVRKDAEKLNNLEVLKSEISNRLLELEEMKAGASGEQLETIRRQIEWYEEKRNKLDAQRQAIEND